MQILHKHLCSSVVIQLASNLQLQMCACTYACLTNVKPVWHSWINKLKSQTGMTNSHNTDLQFQSSSWWFTIPALKRWGICFCSTKKLKTTLGNFFGSWSETHPLTDQEATQSISVCTIWIKLIKDETWHRTLKKKCWDCTDPHEWQKIQFQPGPLCITYQSSLYKDPH
jgi:hypothetical protein